MFSIGEIAKQGGAIGMKMIESEIFDMERALYASNDIVLNNCIFDGSADGESALKESRNIRLSNCFFNLRYPFWHDHGLEIIDSEMTESCRAAVWYSDHIKITGVKVHGIKALRECRQVEMQECDIISSEFGWSVQGIKMRDCMVQSEYFMMRSKCLDFINVHLKGKYSFQYIQDSVFENCVFDTKDAFWHAENVIVRNSIIKGEYLAWYCKNVTFENCRIVGTQPLCYCKNLKLINCEMIETDLCFEKSEVEAVVRTTVISIKNPLSGHIFVPDVGEIIRDDEQSHGEIIIQKQRCCA